MWDVIIGDVVLSAGTVMAAGVGIVAARRAGAARDVGHRNARELEQVKRQTAPRDDQRIRAAVESYAQAHPGLISEAIATEAVRDLLDAIIGANLTPLERLALRERLAERGQ